MARVSTLGTSSDPAPPATRARRPGWRDPRLWVGVAIVAVSVVAGARLLWSADDTDLVWAVSGDHAVGDALSADDLVARRVRFAEGADLDRYLTTDQALPDGARLVRPVGDGELLPRAAIATSSGSQTRLLPVAAAPSAVPPGVAPGSVVDVYLVAGKGCSECADPVLEGVTVVDAPRADDLADTRQLVLSVRAQEAADWFALLAAHSDAAITVVGRG